MQEVAALCDEVVVIAHGVVAASGTPENIRAQTGEGTLEDAFVKLYRHRGGASPDERHPHRVFSRSSARTCASAARCCRP